jgi:squalene synthase HpnC
VRGKRVSDALRHADTYCRQLLQGHYENFWVASPMVPRRLRPHLARIYAYCRTVDDLGDESASPEDAEARLHLWMREVERLFAGGSPTHPVLIALAETVREHGLEARPFLDLIGANLQDQRITRYESWSELQAYCYLSAAPVGRIVLNLFGHADPRLGRLSDDVCIGLQLANFAQDVQVDAARGRTYLLQPEITEGGVPGAVRAMCDRADGLLRSGHELEAAVTGRLRWQVALYRMGGEAILHAIARAAYRTDHVRPTVPMVTKLWLLATVPMRGVGGGTSPRAEQAWSKRKGPFTPPRPSPTSAEEWSRGDEQEVRQ